MDNSTRISEGEISQMRRNIVLNPKSYTAEVRATMTVEKDPLAFLAEENIWFQNLMLWDAKKAILGCYWRGLEFNAENYYNLNPIIYRKTHQKFKTSSRDGEFIGRDFLTNQPIFKKY